MSQSPRHIRRPNLARRTRSRSGASPSLAHPIRANGLQVDPHEKQATRYKIIAAVLILGAVLGSVWIVLYVLAPNDALPSGNHKPGEIVASLASGVLEVFVARLVWKGSFRAVLFVLLMGIGDLLFRGLRFAVAMINHQGHFAWNWNGLPSRIRPPVLGGKRTSAGRGGTSGQIHVV